MAYKLHFPTIVKMPPPAGCETYGGLDHGGYDPAISPWIR